MELTELLEKYADEPSVKVIVEYLKAPTNPSHTISQTPFKQVDKILRYGSDLENLAAKQCEKSTLYSVTLQHMNNVFGSLSETQRLPVLTFYLAKATQHVGLLLNHTIEESIRESLSSASWIEDILQLSEVEPYLRNPDYALLIFHHCYAICDYWNDYELQFAATEDFLTNIYCKLKKVAKDFKLRCKTRTDTYKEELMMVVFHPDRIGPMIERHGLEVMEWGI
jgi:hypothetical protein